jgi:SLT domain-containing protein
MLLEAFVRASGAAMGLARDSFCLDVGPVAGLGSTSGPSATLAAAVSGSGQAASAFNNESNVVDGQVSALGEQNLAANSDLVSALAAAGAGRDQMDSVIAAALADINCLAAATTTLAGQQALVNALALRLEQTWQALTNGSADASTRAASSAQVAAAYSGLGRYPVAGLAPTSPISSTAAVSLMAATSPTQSVPMLTAETMVANQSLLSEAAQLSSMEQQSASNSVDKSAALTSATTDKGSNTDKGSKAAAIPVSAVSYDRGGFAGGRATYENYINQTLDLMGITDKTARNNWMNGLLVGVLRESAYNPSAVNGWDSNAHGVAMPDGFPSGSSRGGLQTIPTTFAAHHQPGTSTNIYNPVANTAAAMNYLMSRYHVLRDGSNLSVVHQFNPNDAPEGY